MRGQKYIELAKSFSSARLAFIALLLVEDKPEGLYKVDLYDDPKLYNRPPSIIIEWLFKGDKPEDKYLYTSTEIKYENT